MATTPHLQTQPGPRKLQERADIMNLYLLLSHYTRKALIPPVGDPKRELHARTVFSTPYPDQEQFVEKEVNKQMRDYLDIASEIWPLYRRNPNDKRLYNLTRPMIPSSELSAPINSTQTDPAKNEDLLKEVKRRYGFVLRKQRSSINHPEAGLGCFVDGKVGLGQVFSIYPGIVYLPQDFRAMKGFPNIDNENANLLGRYDNAVIDAKDGGGIDNEDILEHTNPLALGHMINHPPEGIKPNCMPYNYDFPADFPSNYWPWIPNVYHRPPMWMYRQFGPQPLMKSLVFVAVRDIENEEVFFNYRYNPNIPRPAWYSPVDPAQEKARWTK